VGGNSGSTLVEAWDGTSWSIVPSPNPPGGRFNSVSCTSATFCAAVGFNGQATTEFWNGASWSAVANPATSLSSLNGVSCVSPSFCEAVGQILGSQLIERWNGVVWTTMSVPRIRHLPLGDAVGLQGISCADHSRCIAVGDIFVFAGPNPAFALIETMHGNHWTIVKKPSQPPSSGLSGVSCVSRKACTAVGAIGIAPSSSSFIESLS
jgi:hypothetical protein